MKSFYDEGKNCRVYKCPVCGYEYHDYYDYKERKMNNEKSFLVMEEKLRYNKPIDYAPSELVVLTHYACPNCGVLQIDTSDI